MMANLRPAWATQEEPILKIIKESVMQLSAKALALISSIRVGAEWIDQV